MGGNERARLKIVGVPCASCIVPVRRALERAKGVKYVGANYVADFILVDYDPEVTNVQEIVKTIRKAGYEAVPAFY